MAVQRVKPVRNARRQFSRYTFEELTKGKKPEKALLVGKISKAGRNMNGRITVRHQGGGHKKRLREIDFNQVEKLNIEGTVTSIEYDPNRTCYLMLVTYKDGNKRYHIAPEGMKAGTKIICAKKAKVKIGNRMQLNSIPIGFTIHNVEIFKGKGGQIVRSAGSGAKLISLDGPYAQIELPSKEVRLAPKECYASIGQVSNIEHSNLKVGKAGRSRWMGIRPTVRGKVMNPVDHPHGGGEGKAPIGRPAPVTPWGKPTLGYKTRKKNKPSNKYIVKRRNEK